MPIYEEDQDRTELSDLVLSVMKINRTLKTMLMGAVTSYDLTPLEAMVLATANLAIQPMTVSQLGREIGHGRQAVQRAATALEKKGYLTFNRNPHHKRAPLACITAEGIDIYKQTVSHSRQVADKLFKQLDRSQVADLVTHIQSVHKQLESFAEE